MTGHAQRMREPVSDGALERAVLAEINSARADPRGYAERLRLYRGYFTDKVVVYPGNPRGLLTAEGVAAVDEAIAFLERQPPLPALAPSGLLAGAAGDHVAEQGPRGVTGHGSADGRRAPERVRRRGGGAYVAETITYGPPSAVEVVRQLIVDDGVAGRGHRRIVYSGEFRFAGVRCGAHRVYAKMCVAVFGRAADGQ
ncbi:MAG: CAP domain-containing protein [Sphingomonas sp.]